MMLVLKDFGLTDPAAQDLRPFDSLKRPLASEAVKVELKLQVILVCLLEAMGPEFCSIAEW